METEEITTALRQGRLDGGVLWEPYLSSLLAENPETFKVLHCPFYTEFSALVGLRPRVTQRQEVMDKVLQALIEAEAFGHREPSRVRALLGTALGLAEPSIARLQSESFYWDLGLSATFRAMLEEELFWTRERGIGLLSQGLPEIVFNSSLYALQPEKRVPP